MAVSDNLAATYLNPEDIVDEIAVHKFSIRQLLAKIESQVPVTVIAVHAGTGSPPAAGTVDVQPLLTMLDGDGNATQPGVIYGLPFFRMQGGPWAVICDPVAGDFGYIIAADRDISNVKKNSGIQNPGSYRQFSYSDGIYVGGILNAVPHATLWLKPDGTIQITTKDGVVIKSDGSGNLVMTATTTTVNGNLNVTGSVTEGFGGSDQVGISTHVHSGVTTGTHNSGPPVPGT